MTFKTVFAATAITAAAFAGFAGSASAGGANHYGGHGHYHGHSHVDLGAADASEDFALYHCKALKQRAIATGYSRHWRAYKRCARRFGG